MKTHGKKAMEFSFTWLFAIIVGAVILVLAIYAATRIISMGETETGTAAAKEIGVLLNPLETGFEEDISTLLSLPTDTRIYNGCDASGIFGSQGIRTAQKSFGGFSEPSIEVSFQNKYIFSDRFEEGKQFYIFSKPFDFPFKVADVIYLTPSTEKYCFIDAPEEIEDELGDLKQGNLMAENCENVEDVVNVCFSSGSNCDVKVRYNLGYVEKANIPGRLYFETDALMYAAVFSDNDIYECHVKRLMKRAEELSGIYEKKASLLSQKNCNSNTNTFSLVNSFRNYKDSSDLSSLYISAKEIERENDISSCPLW